MTIQTKSTLAALSLVLMAGTAHAGGFARGTADTDILYENDPVNFRTGATITAPQRGYEKISGGVVVAAPLPSKGSSDYSDSYVVPSVAFKMNLTENARCAGTYTHVYGANSTYDTNSILAGQLTAPTGTLSNEFLSEELGATCALGFDAGKGKVWIIGGIFWENFDFTEIVQFGPAAAAINPALVGTNATLNLSGDYEMGYRIGAAFEIPEIALRIQGLYRSEVFHKGLGEFTNPVLNVAFPTMVAKGGGAMPQSFELRAQSGIAPGTLAFLNVKWQDWSVLQTLDYTISSAPAPIGGAKTKEFFWRDGWTIGGGIAKRISDDVAVALGITWDKGVSTSEDVYTDTWTFGGALNLTDALGGTWRLGGALSYLTAGEVKQSALGATGYGDGKGGQFAYEVGNDWAYTGTISYNIKF